MSKATKRQKDYLRDLIVRIGDSEEFCVDDYTDGAKNSVDDLNSEEASGMIDYLKFLLGEEAEE